ncbi:MAG: hypothetical protein ACE5J9_08335, partial [Methanosarcinales archaeon]
SCRPLEPVTAVRIRPGLYSFLLISLNSFIIGVRGEFKRNQMGIRNEIICPRRGSKLILPEYAQIYEAIKDL